MSFAEVPFSFSTALTIFCLLRLPQISGMSLFWNILKLSICWNPHIFHCMKHIKSRIWRGNGWEMGIQRERPWGDRQWCLWVCMINFQNWEEARWPSGNRQMHPLFYHKTLPPSDIAFLTITTQPGLPSRDFLLHLLGSQQKLSRPKKLEAWNIVFSKIGGWGKVIPGLPGFPFLPPLHSPTLWGADKGYGQRDSGIQ